MGKRPVLAFVLAASFSVLGQQPAPDGAATPPARPEPANDWAQLGRYRDANASVAAEKPSETRVVFLGDSITEAWASMPQVFFPGEGYIGRGISGQTTPQMLLRFQQDVVNLHPRVVVINGGTNDLAGNTGPESLEMIEDNIKSMTQIAASNHIRVVLASITPARAYPWKPGIEPALKIVALNAWMKAWCERQGCIYADYFSALADSSYAMRAGLSSDGVHPNEAGYVIMEPIAERAIRQALAARTN